MGMLVNGEWRDVSYDTSSTGGRFERPPSAFRNWVTADGSPGPTGIGGFVAEAGRYHLYVSLACPWAHRTLIMRRLKGLEDIVTLSVLHWRMRERGWTFSPGPCVMGDPVNGAQALSEVYLAADERYTARYGINIARFAMKLVHNGAGVAQPVRPEHLRLAISQTLGEEALRYVPRS